MQVTHSYGRKYKRVVETLNTTMEDENKPEFYLEHLIFHLKYTAKKNPEITAVKLLEEALLIEIFREEKNSQEDPSKNLYKLPKIVYEWEEVQFVK
tara:strand:+ start:697 stop:984 length:288 start_codon:yes stop_codon:yes gene_type:complete